MTDDERRVLIIGGGMSGMCLAMQLKRAAIPFLILEKAEELGGTWWYNTYPGCQCDIPSQLYSFSFAPNPHWTRVWPGQPEILEYLKECARKFGLYEHTRLGVKALGARFDAVQAMWTVPCEDGSTERARFLVNATGPLHAPRYPDVPGLDSFSGPSFHTSMWRDDVPLEGKRVGVVGSAASAVQLIPHVARQASKLMVYQRTPNYVLEKPDRPYSEIEKRLFSMLPATQKLYRAAHYTLQELLFATIFTPERPTASLLRGQMEKYIREMVTDPELLGKVMPSYLPGCKRILFENDYYPALQRPNVTLTTDSIEAVEADGIRAGGQLEQLDVIIYATGFSSWDHGWMRRIERGDGRSIDEHYGEHGLSYLGLTMPGVPNFFTLLGPNTGLGHNSIVWMMECQVEHLVRMLKATAQRRARTIEARPDLTTRYQRSLDRRLEKRVWSKGGCSSWYQDEQGRVFALWPDHTFEYRKVTRAAGPEDYLFA